MRQAQVDEQNGIGSRFLLLFSTHRIPTFFNIAVVEFAENIDLSTIFPGTLLQYGRPVLEVLCLGKRIATGGNKRSMVKALLDYERVRYSMIWDDGIMALILIYA